jgi:hypothetical protein
MDATRYHELAPSVDDLRASRRTDGGADLHDATAVDADINIANSIGVDDAATADQQPACLRCTSRPGRHGHPQA